MMDACSELRPLPLLATVFDTASVQVSPDAVGAIMDGVGELVPEE